MTTLTTTTTTESTNRARSTRTGTKPHDGHGNSCCWKRLSIHPRFQKLRRRYTRFIKDFNQLQPHQKAIFITFISIVLYVIIRNVWFVSLEEITENVNVKVFVDEPLCKILNIQPSSSLEKSNLPLSEEAIKIATCPFKACNAYTKVVTLNETQALIRLTEESRKCEDLTTCCAIVHCIPRKNNEEIRYPIDGCYSLKDSTDIQPSVYTDVLETQCHDLCDNRRITNFHPLLPLTPKVEQKLAAWTERQRSNQFKSINEIPRVIFIVLDHVSRNQAEKYLTQTLETLRSGKWGNYHDFRGYSMVDETIEGNFQSALTGFNSSILSQKCSFSHYGYFDGCPWIWKEFRNMDYITSYIDESTLKDSSPLSKFMGDFVAQPTDYFVPASFIQDKMQWNQMDDELFNAFASTSPKDFLFSHSSTFYRKFSDYPYFSTMRLNSDATTTLRKLDSKLSSLFKDIAKFSENSLVIFASHTDLQKTFFSDLNLLDKKAFQHQRPFFFISVPKSMKEFEHNLKINSNRLTTVFDVHETFRHVALHSCQLLGSTIEECILELNQHQQQEPRQGQQSDNYHEQKSKKEENTWGVSLLQPISSIRNCDIAGIPHSICPCIVDLSLYSATTVKLMDSNSYHYKIHELSTSRT